MIQITGVRGWAIPDFLQHPVITTLAFCCMPPFTQQGVITFIRPVEPSASGIKMSQPIKKLLRESSNQGVFQIAN